MFIRSKTLGHSKRLFHLSLGAFLVFLGAFVVCSNVDFSESVGATDVSSKFTVSLNDVLTISSPSEIVLNNCNPSTASLCTTSANVTVSTNNLTGYSLYLNSTSGSSSSLTNTATTPNPTIPTLSQSYSSANFPVNSWGYTGGTDQSGETGGYNCSTNYCPILDYEADPTDYSPNHIIKQTDTPAATSTTNLTFAAKADTSKASGTYTTSITFTAITNALPDYTARLDTGQTVNAKLKSLAAGTTTAYDTNDSLIKSIDVHLETPAPTGFIPSADNTISSSESKNPIYIIFDNTNNAGIMHFYTEGEQIVLSPDSSFMFYFFFNLSEISGTSDWDTSIVTDMSYMFYDAGYSANTFTLDLSDWNTSNVTGMSYMFHNAGRFATTFTLDLSDWNTSNVTNMSNMFQSVGYSATTFTLNLSGWNTSNVTNMSYMFSYAGYSATTFALDLSGWNTSSVTRMNDMFSYAGFDATTFTLDLSGWNTSSVTDMDYMFQSAGHSATNWSVTIPPTNGNNISNTTSNMYGKTTSVYGEPDSGKSFTLAQP
ncbi:DUF285 domain-containing protein [Candidatus Saccharibacteria bacterium]|nr:DUF285 domain-containing protein [Candidatus Saccharibacteria bacterium]